MAEFETECPYCQTTLEADTNLIGKSVQCPECQEYFMIRHSKANGALCLYSPATAGILSIIFSPVFSAGCIWSNYKSLKNSEESSKYLYFFILNIVILIGNIIFLLRKTSFAGPFIKGIDLIIEAVCSIFCLLWWGWNYIEISKHIQFLKEQNIVYKEESFTTPVLIAIALSSLVFVTFILVNTR